MLLEENVSRKNGKRNSTKGTDTSHMEEIPYHIYAQSLLDFLHHSLFSKLLVPDYICDLIKKEYQQGGKFKNRVMAKLELFSKVSKVPVGKLNFNQLLKGYKGQVAINDLPTNTRKEILHSGFMIDLYLEQST